MQNSIGCSPVVHGLKQIKLMQKSDTPYFTDCLGICLHIFLIIMIMVYVSLKMTDTCLKWILRYYA